MTPPSKPGAPPAPSSASSANVDESVAVRLDEDILARVDALATVITPLGSRPRRGTTLRAIVLKGLEAFEAERATAPATPAKPKGGKR